MPQDPLHKLSLEDELNDSSLLRNLIDSLPEQIYIKDLEGRYVLNNVAHVRALDAKSPEELAGKTDFDFYPKELAERYRAGEQEVIDSGRSLVDKEELSEDDEGNEGWHSITKVPVRDDNGEIVGLVGMIREVTERKGLEERLEHQAFHDSLTDLPNRVLFMDRLGHVLARTRREDDQVAVLLMDLNRFKLINDSLGHDAGNAVLVEVAERVRNSVRPGDTVGRIFGDEFAILLEPPAGVEEARRVAGRIEEVLREPFDVDGREVFVSASIGFTLGESAEEKPEDFLRHADLAMYTAKRGKAECQVYSPNMEAQVAERMGMERNLRRAVEREKFEAHYQPIVELHTGEICGVEALARWRHPERGLVEAEEFIEIAEETGLIRPIGQQVVDEACRQVKEWRRRYPQGVPMLSVNLSANEFLQQPNLIRKVLDETGLEPNTLQVEITERTLMNDAEFALAELEELKDLGVSLAIDDFGMGYSCLYRLKQMPIDCLKIDKAFIAGLGDDQGDEAIVAGTVGLAHALGVIVVAEGVETADQQEILRELRCDLVQGHYFAKPLPSEAMERLLAEGTSY